MIDAIIQILICLFEVFMFYTFLNGILEKRFEKNGITYLIIVCMTAIEYIINRLHITQLNLFGVSFLFLVGALLLFTGTVKKRVSCFLIYYIIMMGMEFVAGVVVSVIGDYGFVTEHSNPYNNFFLISITKLMSFVALRFAKMFINRNAMGIGGRLFRLTFLVPITTILLYTGLFYANIRVERGRWLLSVGCVLLLFSNVLVFYIFEKLKTVMLQNKEYELMELQNSYTNAYYKKLEEVGDKNKKYAHDLKQYLQTIGGLASKSKDHEIIAILRDMEVEIDSISDKLYTTNSILNALLCEKEQQAMRLGITLHIMIEPNLNLDFIANGDLIVMVGNLLSNAIEAASTCKDEKKIDLKFFESEGCFVVLDIENTYGNRILKKGSTYFTTKKDATYHGIGIRSVRDVAVKYGGILYQEHKEDSFVTLLTLSKSLQNNV